MSAARLGLGTAQFGFAYGITNAAGQVSGDAVPRLLARAREAGIDTLDTAAGYGEAETVLGTAGAAALGFRIVTKIAGPPSGFADAARASATRLGAVPDAILLHDAAALAGPGGKEVADALLGLREAGLARGIGVSVYAPEVLAATLDRLVPDVVQLPFNVFDRRFERTGWLDRLSGLGVAVHARSLFLQGTLLAAETPPPLAFAAARFAAFRAACRNGGITPLAACLSVGLAAPIDRLIIGVTAEAELAAILAAVDPPPQPLPALADLATDDLALIDPSRWQRG
ncbi:aldo/keto reductase [Elioraea sp.]|uniref:aldo/keto reductase n=1 Tax=Elioraea sp. TaxID=2185103 RepID=UPI0025BA5E41|nr:aldo/keto reductase [Elioraea sp.]